MAISAVYCRTAFMYRSQMLFYVADIGHFGERAEGTRRIGRLAFWLAVSAFCIWGTIASGLFVLYMWTSNRENGAVALFYAYATFAFFRIASSLAPASDLR
mmetsp:Transcript_49388/g.112083  ORF Transcript_49388/g.112083 Transcript_49388/m.112083 type:complete len:101 (-) Transcript_49388:66-368(-)